MVATTTRSDGRPEGYRDDDPAYHETINAAPSLLARISWGAIFAGAVIALGLTLLFGLMGTALGFGAIDPRSSDPFGGLGIGTAIWWILTSVISLGIGGYVAGRDSGQTDRSAAMSHGAAMWGLVTLITAWLATSAIGTAVNTATSAVSSVASTSAQAIGSVGGAILPDNVDISSPEVSQARDAVRQEAEQVLANAGITDGQIDQAGNEIASAAGDVVRNPAQLDEEVGRLIDGLFQGEGAVFSPADRQRLVETLSERAGVSPEEAEQIATRWEQQAQSTVQTTTADIGEAAVSASDTALDAMSSAAWYAFFAGLLSLAAAIGASAVGAPSRPYVTERH